MNSFQFPLTVLNVVCHLFPDRTAWWNVPIASLSRKFRTDSSDIQSIQQLVCSSVQSVIEVKFRTGIGQSTCGVQFVLSISRQKMYALVKILVNPKETRVVHSNDIYNLSFGAGEDLVAASAFTPTSATDFKRKASYGILSGNGKECLFV